VKEALVVMAKAPREGEVKTRLIGALTAAEAAAIYTNFLRDTFVLAEAVRDERETVQFVLCYTPAGSEQAFENIEREGSLMLAQRGGDLGERLTNCFADLFEFGFDSVVVIGADSPTLPEEILVEAFDLLTGENDVVIGPAEDKGYYLVGMRKLHAEVFNDIPWGTDRTLAHTEARVREAGLNLVLLPVWYDVDTPEELERLKRELDGNKDVAKFTRRFLKTLVKSALQARH
jgi:rSAM/selenodomain-associated transferase 1